MKRKMLILTGLCSVLAMFSCSSTQNAAERQQKIAQKIESKDYTISVNTAYPMRGKAYHLSSGYDLKIKNDSAIAYLPYYGVAHTAPINPSEGGIKFSEPMKDYKITPNKKQDGWEISFKIDKGIEHYDVRLSIFKNASTSISVSSYNRDPISFRGEIIE